MFPVGGGGMSGGLLALLGLILFWFLISVLVIELGRSPTLIQILVVGGIGYFFWSNSKSSE